MCASELFSPDGPPASALRQLPAFVREGLTRLDVDGCISRANARPTELCGRGAVVGLRVGPLPGSLRTDTHAQQARRRQQI